MLGEFLDLAVHSFPLTFVLRQRRKLLQQEGDVADGNMHLRSRVTPHGAVQFQELYHARKRVMHSPVDVGIDLQIVNRGHGRS